MNNSLLKLFEYLQFLIGRGLASLKYFVHFISLRFGLLVCYILFVGWSNTSLAASSAGDSLTGSPASASLTIKPAKAVKKMGLKHWTGLWNLGVVGKSYAEETEKSTSMTFQLGALFQVPISPILNFKGDLGFDYRTGHIQNRYENVRSGGEVFANEVVMRVQPIEYLSFDVGIIDQSFLHSEMLISQRGFPGVRLGLGLSDLNQVKVVTNGSNSGTKNKIFDAKLYGQYSIPTATTFDDERVENEPTPAFITQTLEINWRPIPAVHILTYGSFYEYQDLPALVAHKGSFWGNSVTGAIPEDAKFLHEYQGYLLGGEFCLCPQPSTWSFKWGGQRIENLSAPEAFGLGQMVYGELKTPHWQGPRWIIRGESFFNESDTAPAFYNSSRLGHNNRVGQAYSVGFEWDKWKIRLMASYVASDLINSPENTTQGPLGYTEIRWETYRVEF